MTALAERTHDTTVRGGRGIDQLGTIGLLMALVAVTLGFAGGLRVATDAVDGYGLITAFPTVYWLGVGLAVVATFALLRASASTGHSRHGAAVPTLWLLLLHTAPQLAHAHVRQPLVWTNLGFVRLIDETRGGDVGIDTRFAWPGFFGTFIAPLARLDSWLVEALLRAWPTLITGATAILVAALAQRSYPTVPLVGSLSALASVFLSWTGQDYFSPQGVGFLWYLAILVILESGPLQAGSAWSGSVPGLSHFAASGGDRPSSRSTPAFVALVILSLAAIVSHPLVPFFICAALVVLGLYGRTLAWRLLLLAGVAYVLWYLVSGEPSWSAPIEETADQLGGLMALGSPEHRFVSNMRLYLVLATVGSMLAIGAIVATERFRHLRPAIPLVPLAVAPASAVVLTNFGGEIFTPILLFTIPMTAILIGRLLASVPTPAGPVVVALIAVALTPVLLVTRFGDERFEFTTGPDRAAVEAAYANADDDTLFVADNRFLAWRDQTVGRNTFVEVAVEQSESWIADVEAKAGEAGKDRIIVVLTDSQLGWKIHGESLPDNTLDDFAQWLLDREGSELLFHEERAWTIEL